MDTAIEADMVFEVASPTKDTVKIERVFARSSIAQRIQQAKEKDELSGVSSQVEININKFQEKTPEQIAEEQMKKEKEEATIMKNMEKLSKASEEMNDMLNLQKQKQQEKANIALAKQQEIQLQIEQKLNILVTEQEGTKTKLEETQTKLRQIKENTYQKKQEMNSLSQLKQQLANSIKSDQEVEVQQKNEQLNEMITSLENIKSQIKTSRQSQLGWEQKITAVEQEKNTISVNLNDIAKSVQEQSQLQHTIADLEQVLKENERIRERMAKMQSLIKLAEEKNQSLNQNIKSLNEQQFQLKNQIQEVSSETSRQALFNELSMAKQQNKQQFDKNLQLMSEMKEIQVKVQIEETKGHESVEIANLLKDQNKFERESRIVQVEIEAIEDLQRLREDTRKEIQTNLIQIQQEADQNNPELQMDVIELEKELKKSVEEKQLIEDEIRALMAKVCNKKPEELHIEEIDNYFEQLINSKQILSSFRKKEQVLQDQIELLGERYHQYENKLKDQFHKQSTNFILENNEIIIQVAESMQKVNEKAAYIDALLRQKQANSDEQIAILDQVRVQLSQFKSHSSLIKRELNFEKGYLNDFKDNHELNKSLLNTVIEAKKGLQSYEVTVIDFVVVRKDLFDQNERLKLLNGKNINDLEDLLSEVKKQLDQLDEAQAADQQDKQNKFINDGQILCDQIDKEIKALNERLETFNNQVQNLSPDDQKSILAEIEHVKNTLELLQQGKNSLQVALNEISAQGTVNQNLNQIQDIIDDLLSIKDIDIKVVEKDIDRIEEQLKLALRQYKSDLRKEGQNSGKKAESIFDDINVAIGNIQAKIELIQRDCSHLQKQYHFEDKEREDDIAQTKANVSVQQKELDSLNELRDSFKKKLDQYKRTLHEINLNNSNNKNKDEVEIWLSLINEAKLLMTEMEPIIQNLNIVDNQVDQIRDNLDKNLEKFKAKNISFQLCKDKNDTILNKLDNIAKVINQSESQLKEVKQLFDQLIPVQESESFSNLQEQHSLSYMAKIDNLAQQKERLTEQKAKLSSIMEPVSQLPIEIITNEILEQVIRDLDAFETDLSGQLNSTKEQLKKNLDLNVDAKDLYEMNKQLKEKEISYKLNDLQIDLAKIEKLYKDATNKLQKYRQLIEKSLKCEDESVVKAAQKLKEEAAEIEKELKFIDTLKNNLKSQDLKLRETQNQLQTKKDIQIKDLDNLSKDFNDINVQSGQAIKELVKINNDLDNRINELNDYMSKFNDLQGQYKDFDNLINQIADKSYQLSNKIEDQELLVQKLQAVLEEMERGLPRDYIDKEALIIKLIHEIEVAKSQIQDLKKQKQVIQENFDTLQGDSEQQLDNEALGSLKENAQNLLKELDNLETTVNKCAENLNIIQQQIGDADIPRLIQERENELKTFFGKFQKTESDLLSLKNILAQTEGIDNKAQLEQKLNELDLQILKQKECSKGFNRIFQNELHPLQANPKELVDLDRLKNAIKITRELGDAINQSTEQMDKFQISLSDLNNLLGGMDLMKRYRELCASEEDHQSRLADVKERFERISKGASDCDGYTSNTEEANFIVKLINQIKHFVKLFSVQDTLLGEIPEMLEKQQESVDYSNNTKDTLVKMLPAVQKASMSQDPEASHQQVNTDLDGVEEKVNINEKTVKFLEKLADKLENHFMQMEVKKKLDKRQMELKELQNICSDFESQLLEMQKHLRKDLNIIEQKRASGELADQTIDEEGVKINLLEELEQVQIDLQSIFEEVNDLEEKNTTIQRVTQATQKEFNETILSKPPYKGQTKITNKGDIFTLLKANGWMKRKIIDMIRAMKEVSKRMKDTKSHYQETRARLAKVSAAPPKQAPAKKYKAIKGDPVDEMLATYLNKIGCPVPVTRLGKNQYSFGTKKIFAKIINGNLVIRVGGGYMGIEEFMMYYGQQELLRLQKRDGINIDEADDEDYDAVTVQTTDGDEQESVANKNGRQDYSKSTVDQVSKTTKKKAGDQEESKSPPKKATVVGMADVRKALKHSMVEIKTYQDHSTISKMNTAAEVQSRNQVHQNSTIKRIGTDSKSVKEQLKTMETKASESKKSNQLDGSSRQALKTPRPTTTSTSAQLSGSKIGTGSSAKKRESLNGSVLSAAIESPDSKLTTPRGTVSGKFASKIPSLKK